MTDQPRLIPSTKDEQIASLRDALEKYGKHTLYCGWDRVNGLYDRDLDCTCGLGKAKESEK